MIFKCTARYEVYQSSNRTELRDLGKLEHTFYNLKSFDDARDHFSNIIDKFKKIFHCDVSIQIIDIHLDE
jgi:hypothetical protein